ncbi:MAG TPA: NADPH-dependent FMN reductase [Polyangia bacterium]|nr:NADPH-dependent FMN reductase [Polyangia bacterium]
MSRIVTISGSPSPTSRTSLLARHVGAKLAGEGFTIDPIEVRDLPAEDLLLARPTAPALSAALGLVEKAQGIVVATPIYKAAYSGILKAFLDLLPQFGLAGKVVLPLATGGSLAHVLAVDYALRPMLSSMNPLHIVPGLFLAEAHLERKDGGLVIEAGMAKWLDQIVGDFVTAVRRAPL